MVSRTDYVHRNILIHRGIKPDDFPIGMGITILLLLIDFGLTQKYGNNSIRLEFP